MFVNITVNIIFPLSVIVDLPRLIVSFTQQNCACMPYSIKYQGPSIGRAAQHYSEPYPAMWPMCFLATAGQTAGMAQPVLGPAPWYLLPAVPQGDSFLQPSFGSALWYEDRLCDVLGKELVWPWNAQQCGDIARHWVTSPDTLPPFSEVTVGFRRGKAHFNTFILLCDQLTANKLTLLSVQRDQQKSWSH